MQEEGEGPPRAVDLRGKEEGELRDEGGVRDPLRGKEEGELWTACGGKEWCGIQKVGVGGGSHHVGAIGKNRLLETEVTVDHRFSFAPSSRSTRLFSCGPGFLSKSTKRAWSRILSFCCLCAQNHSLSKFITSRLEN